MDDFKGLKIRTMENPVDVGIFNAIGAQATPMAYSELFTAIQQGTVDGGENTIANYLSDGFSEVAPYLTLDGRVYPAVVDGRVKWIVDGYTTSDAYPYSQMTDLGSVTQDSTTKTSNTIQALG